MQVACYRVVCLASVSTRVNVQTLEQKEKKKFSLFLTETLATQAIFIKVEWLWSPLDAFFVFDGGVIKEGTNTANPLPPELHINTAQNNIRKLANCLEIGLYHNLKIKFLQNRTKNWEKPHRRKPLPRFHF